MNNPLNIDPQFYSIPPNEIIPRLWIGNFYDGENLEQLSKLNIDVIVNLTGSIRLIFPNKLYLVVGLNQPFLHTKEDAVKVVNYIERLHKNGFNILVHCLSGKDRAPTVVAKFLEQRWSSQEKADEFIKDKRPNCIPHWDWW